MQDVVPSQVNQARSRSLWRRVIRGVVRTAGPVLLGMAWFVAANCVIRWYFSLPCPSPHSDLHNDPGPGAGFAMLFIDMIAFPLFVAYSLCAIEALLRLRRHRVLTGAALACGALLVTWTYLVIMIQTLTWSVYFERAYGGEHPPAWPPIPIPMP